MNALQEINIRKASEEDLPQIKFLFKDTVSTVAKMDYNQQQIDAWVSTGENIQKWIDKLNTEYFLITEKLNSIVGFGSLANSYYIDYLYVHKDFQR